MEQNSSRLALENSRIQTKFDDAQSRIAALKDQLLESEVNEERLERQLEELVQAKDEPRSEVSDYISGVNVLTLRTRARHIVLKSLRQKSKPLKMQIQGSRRDYKMKRRATVYL